MLEEYEKLNKLAEAQRIRLKKLQQQEAYNTRLNKKLLLNIHRKAMRNEKVAALRKEIEILAQNHGMSHANQLNPHIHCLGLLNGLISSHVPTTPVPRIVSC